MLTDMSKSPPASIIAIKSWKGKRVFKAQPVSSVDHKFSIIALWINFETP